MVINLYVYMVTSKSTDTDSSGKIAFVRANCHGVFSTLDRANDFAQKYGGVVDTFLLDTESRGVAVQYWENPGFVDG